MADKFKRGDMVRHKTSDQKMIVTGYYVNPNIGPSILANKDLAEKTDLVNCEWLFDGIVKRDKFHENDLILLTK